MTINSRSSLDGSKLLLVSSVISKKTCVENHGSNIHISFSVMALPISSAAPATMIFSNSQFNGFRVVTIKCESKEPPPPETGLRLPAKSSKLEIGSPVILIEAPKMIKTAASVPCLRVNSGLVNPGDVGRIVSRKPKDVWAVRLTIGTYLIDGKYFEPLQLEE